MFSQALGPQSTTVLLVAISGPSRAAWKTRPVGHPWSRTTRSTRHVEVYLPTVNPHQCKLLCISWNMIC